jgi:hypothetical protein
MVHVQQDWEWPIFALNEEILFKVGPREMICSFDELSYIWSLTQRKEQVGTERPQKLLSFAKAVAIDRDDRVELPAP